MAGPDWNSNLVVSATTDRASLSSYEVCRWGSDGASSFVLRLHLFALALNAFLRPHQTSLRCSSTTANETLLHSLERMPIYADHLPNEIWTRVFKSMFEHWSTPDRSTYRPPRRVERNEVCARWQRYGSSRKEARLNGGEEDEEEEDEEAELDRALWTCARVSRRFNAIATPILYEHIFLCRSPTRSAWSTLVRLRKVVLDDASRSDSRSLGKMVRYLDFGFEDYEGMPEDPQSMVMIGTLLAHLPNLKDFGHSLYFPPLLDTLSILSRTLHLSDLFLSLDSDNYLSCFTAIAHLSPHLRHMRIDQGNIQQCDDDQTPSLVDLQTPIIFPHLHTIELDLCGYTSPTLLDRIAFWKAPSLRKASFSFQSREEGDQLNIRALEGPILFLNTHGHLLVEAEIKLSSISIIDPLLTFVNLLHLETSPFDIKTEKEREGLLFTLSKLRTLVVVEVEKAELVDSFFEMVEELQELKDVVWRDRTWWWGRHKGWDGRRIISWGRWLKKKGVELSWNRT